MKKNTPLQILIANGVNIDLLGQRQPGIYGAKNLDDLEKTLNTQKNILEKIFSKKIKLTFFQSNWEGAFLEALTKKKWDGIIINPGAWTHTSLALADRLKAIDAPYLEVHLSNVHQRETIRHKSLISAGAKGVLCGMGFVSYEAGLYGLIRLLSGQAQ